MQTKIVYAILALIIAININYTKSEMCSEKEIFEEIFDPNYTLTQNYYDHYKKAYHGISSCASLRSDEDYCCYIKIKFKNIPADEKYTHRGLSLIHI